LWAWVCVAAEVPVGLSKLGDGAQCDSWRFCVEMRV
jgi:hypothetical protein